MLFLIPYNIILTYVCYAQSTYINKLVKLVCEGCMPNRNQCCVGMALTPNHILTTNYCAKMCSSVDINGTEFSFTKTHEYPNPKTFVFSYGFSGPDTVAIIVIKNYIYVKHNIRDSISDTSVNLYGLYASFPVSNSKIFLKTTVIKKCDEESDFSNTYYICTYDESYDDYEVPQGTPLFKGMQFIGIKGANSRSSINTGTVFLSLAPLAYWILYNTREDNGIVQILRRFNSIETPAITTVPLSAVNGNNNANTICNTDKIIQEYINKKQKLKITKYSQKTTRQRRKLILTKKIKKSKQTTRKQKSVKNSSRKKISIATLKGYKKTIKSQIRKVTVSVKKDCSRPNEIISRITIAKPTKLKSLKLTKKFSKAKFSSTKSTSRIKTTKSKTVSSSLKKSKVVKSTNKLIKKNVTKVTNALDWFNKMKTMRQTNFTQVLVLTTTRKMSEFLDLT